MLRKAFKLPTFDNAKVHALTKLANSIIDKLDRNKSNEVDTLINRFNSLAEVKLTKDDFYHVSGSMDVEEFVKITLSKPTIVEHISYEELKEIVYKLTEGPPEHQVMWYLKILEKAFPNAPISDLIFYPKSDNMTDVVNSIWNYKTSI